MRPDRGIGHEKFAPFFANHIGLAGLERPGFEAGFALGDVGPDERG